MLLVRSSLVSMYPQRIHSLKFYKPKTNLSEKDLKKKGCYLWIVCGFVFHMAEHRALAMVEYIEKKKWLILVGFP
ncbi:hypothetical protein Hanom_Chr05g00461421 [Helianthus anomalus]